MSLTIDAPERIAFAPDAVSRSLGARVVLVRHGRPAVSMSRTCYRGFRRFIDAYERAGLDPESVPPAELRALVAGLVAVFISGTPRADESARSLLPHARIIRDPLFAEAPLAGPRIPLLRMTVGAWAVISRIMWHAGYHPEMESYRRAIHRASRAADRLLAGADTGAGTAVLVAHGYFNAMIGRVLRQRGFIRIGSHRATFWNAVTYERRA